MQRNSRIPDRTSVQIASNEIDESDSTKASRPRSFYRIEKPLPNKESHLASSMESLVTHDHHTINANPNLHWYPGLIPTRHAVLPWTL